MRDEQLQPADRSVIRRADRWTLPLSVLLCMAVVALAAFLAG